MFDHSESERLPLRHAVGERAGERWCSGFRGAKHVRYWMLDVLCRNHQSRTMKGIVAQAGSLLYRRLAVGMGSFFFKREKISTKHPHGWVRLNA